MSEREPTLQDVLREVQGIGEKVTANGAAVGELRGEMGEVRIGLGDVRGRLDRLGGEIGELRGEVTAQGSRLDALTGEVETLRTDLPVQVVAGVLVGFERSAYVTDLRILQAEVAELKADMAEMKRASGE